MKDKCIKCDEKVYTASLCKRHYKEAFEKNKKGLSERFDLK